MRKIYIKQYLEEIKKDIEMDGYLFGYTVWMRIKIYLIECFT